ncbi:hypothetical protein BC828DRAFT_174321 [Blastocladiella britannica]|nr:hypothetical protein BC828DRAFT_174321 [Blastocladiella britannica]
MGDISDEQEGGPDLSDPFFMISKRATKRPKTHSATLSAIEAYRTRQATKIVPRVKCDIRGPHKPMSDKIRAIRTILWQKHDEAGVERQLNIVRTDKDEIQGYLWEGSSEQFAQDRMTPLWLNFPVLAVLKAYLEMQPLSWVCPPLPPMRLPAKVRARAPGQQRPARQPPRAASTSAQDR